MTLVSAERRVLAHADQRNHDRLVSTAPTPGPEPGAQVRFVEALQPAVNEVAGQPQRPVDGRHVGTQVAAAAVTVDLEHAAGQPAGAAECHDEQLLDDQVGALRLLIQKVTAEQVTQAGRKYFPLARMTAIAVGDEKVIQEELAPLGIEVKPAP